MQRTLVVFILGIAILLLTLYFVDIICIMYLLIT
ncbi:hypothetical protein CTS44_20863 [Comamonas thiooxydans]|nr:hypothetical protein CTS44_20863 [Comamonas thiooxydans]